VIPLHDDNETTLTPLITIALIGVCVIFFIGQFSLGDEAYRVVGGLGMTPAALLKGYRLPIELSLVSAEVTVLTSMFLHGGWGHLIGNMLYLWIFGNNVEDAMGHVRFLFFYLLCGVIAGLIHAFDDPTSTLPVVGASGAISGLLGAYFVLFPKARVLVLIPLGFFWTTVRVPAIAAIGVWIAFQVISGLLADTATSGVAWWAHIGGFVAGMLLVFVFHRSSAATAD
jgi:membrane associated rhomboid family serine protease